MGMWIQNENVDTEQECEYRTGMGIQNGNVDTEQECEYRMSNDIYLFYHLVY